MIKQQLFSLLRYVSKLKGRITDKKRAFEEILLIFTILTKRKENFLLYYFTFLPAQVLALALPAFQCSCSVT
jgi:hypothetical protein